MQIRMLATSFMPAVFGGASTMVVEKSWGFLSELPKFSSRAYHVACILTVAYWCELLSHARVVCSPSVRCIDAFVTSTPCVDRYRIMVSLLHAESYRGSALVCGNTTHARLAADTFEDEFGPDHDKANLLAYCAIFLSIAIKVMQAATKRWTARNVERVKRAVLRAVSGLSKKNTLYSY